MSDQVHLQDRPILLEPPISEHLTGSGQRINGTEMTPSPYSQNSTSTGTNEYNFSQASHQSQHNLVPGPQVATMPETTNANNLTPAAAANGGAVSPNGKPKLNKFAYSCMYP